MDKIQQSNDLLDALQRKMQNHFKKHHSNANNQLLESELTKYTNPPPKAHQYSNSKPSVEEDPQAYFASERRIVEERSQPHLLASQYTEQNANNGQQYEIREDPSGKKGSQPHNYRLGGKQNNYRSYFNYSNKKNTTSRHPQTVSEPFQLVDPSHGKDSKNFKEQTFKLFNRKKKEQAQRQSSMDVQVTENTPWKRATPYGYNAGESFNPREELYFKQRQNTSPNIPIGASQSQSLQPLQAFQNLESLLSEKLSVKQERIRHLESQLKLQNQQRVHLYKLNLQLEEDYKELVAERKAKQQDQVKGLTFLVQRLVKMKHERAAEKKALLQQQKLLKQQQKQLLRGRRQFVDRDRRNIEKEVGNCPYHGFSRSKSRTQIHALPPGLKMYEEDSKASSDKILYELVSELDRLKNVVEKRMRQADKKKKNKVFK